MRLIDADALIENKFKNDISYNAFVSLVKRQPSAQPESESAEMLSGKVWDEWCTGCKEYDQERHCCPRFNRVIRTALDDAQPERIRGRWSGFYSELNDDTHLYGDKLMEGDTVYLLGVEGYVSCECGAWGWGSPNYVPWEQLESRMPHNNAPTFCYCDNFISFWELKWNFDDGNDWDGVPYIKHHSNCGADMREEEQHEIN